MIHRERGEEEPWFPNFHDISQLKDSWAMKYHFYLGLYKADNHQKAI